MKIPVFFSSFLLSCCFAFSQAVLSTEQKIYEVYGTDFFEDSPDGFTFYKDLLDKRVLIVEEPLMDGDKYPKIGDFPLMNKYNSSVQPFSAACFSVETFNPLRYQLSFSHTKHPVVYRIDDTNYILVIKPQYN